MNISQKLPLNRWVKTVVGGLVFLTFAVFQVILSPSESAYRGRETERFQPSIGDYFTRDINKPESSYLDWSSAAADGNEWAQCCMGDFWYTGDAGYPNHSEALKWWLASAEQGNVVAKYKLIKYYFLRSFEEWCISHPFIHGLFF